MVGLVRWAHLAADQAAHHDDRTDGIGRSEIPTKPLPKRPVLLLTIEEAAERLQVGRCTMQNLLISGEVRSIKIGRLRRIPPDALEDYIERHLAG